LKRPFEGTILETHTKKGRGIRGNNSVPTGRAGKPWFPAKGRGVRGNLGFLQKEGACGETLVSRNIVITNSIIQNTNHNQSHNNQV
jgi:hypothetical protein